MFQEIMAGECLHSVKISVSKKKKKDEDLEYQSSEKVMVWLQPPCFC